MEQGIKRDMMSLYGSKKDLMYSCFGTGFESSETLNDDVKCNTFDLAEQVQS